MTSMEERLISLVRKNRHLYDKSDKSYKDSVKADNTWNYIRAELGLPDVGPNKAKKRWVTLRQKFSRDFKKSPSGSGATKNPWQFYESMSFLKDYIENRERATNFEFDETEGIEMADEILELDVPLEQVTDSTEEEFVLETHLSEPDSRPTTSFSEPVCSRPSTASTTDSRQSPASSKKRKTDGKDSILDAIKQTRSEINTMLMQAPVENEIDAYVMAIGVCMKKMSKARYLRAKHACVVKNYLRAKRRIISELEEEELLESS